MHDNDNTWAGGLTSDFGEEPLVAPESVSFLAFNDWMDVQLERLVAQWEHAAAPHASHAWIRERKRHAGA